MGARSKRVTGFGVLVLALAVLSFWYWSPYWDLRQMATAAKTHDADTFNEHVDYPKLRESLKGQFSARMATAVPAMAKDNPFAGLGAMLGMGLVNQMVDAMVRPEFVMKAMQQGKMSAPPSASADSPAAPERQDAPKWDFERKGVNKVVAYPADPKKAQPVTQRPAFVFERSGFATWKLTELRLPETQ